VDEVAKKAGVGARTVFRQFDDLDTLFRGLAERVEREVFALVTPAPLSGDLHQDLAALIERRKKIYEHITPFRHASRQMRQTSPFIRERDAALAHAFRSILEAIVVPHLPGEAATTIEMLDVLLSFETWDRLRQVQKQSVEQTEAIVLEASKTLTDQARRRQAKP
jgi:AcrR family transcriptional regulator